MKPRLVTAHDIAAQRVRELPADSFESRMLKVMQYQRELRRAVEEKARGEWQLGGSS